MNSTFMENAIGINEMWKPLSSSYTQTENDSGGQTKKMMNYLQKEYLVGMVIKNEGTQAGK